MMRTDIQGHKNRMIRLTKGRALCAFVAACLNLLLLSACAPLSTETRVEEGVWQSVNLIDALQTVNMVGEHPNCFAEVGELGINGRHPDSSQIEAYHAAYGLIHYGVTWLLSRGDWSGQRWVLRFWEGFTLVDSSAAVASSRQAWSSGHTHCVL
jgi:hypothetical protein